MYENEHPSILMLAVKKGYEDICELLIKKGEDIDEKYYDTTPVMTAIINNNFNIFKLLVDSGASTKGRAFFGKDCLYLAVMSGNKEILNLLLQTLDKNGEKIEFSNDLILNSVYRYPPIEEKYRYDIVNYMINYGVNFNIENKAGYTPLLSSIDNESVRVSELLMDHSISHGHGLNLVDNTGRTLLFHACHKRNKEIVSLLLNKGADPCQIDRHGNTIFYYLTEDFDEEIFGILKDAVGGDMNLIEQEREDRKGKEESKKKTSDFEHKRIAIDYIKKILWRNDGISFEMNPLDDVFDEGRFISYLLDNSIEEYSDLFDLKNFDFNKKYSSGRTLLMLSAWVGSNKSYDFLIKNGANEFDLDEDGRDVSYYKMHKL